MENNSNKEDAPSIFKELSITPLGNKNSLDKLDNINNINIISDSTNSSDKSSRSESLKINDELNLDVQIVEKDKEKCDLTYKIIVVGNTAVGKTCLTAKATKDVFYEEYMTTIGFDYFNYIMKINGNMMKLQIWDTCGQEVYRSLISNFYRSSALAVIVYAINDRKSFDDLDVWLKQIKANSSCDLKMILIGNKADLEEERHVSFEEGKKFAIENNFVFFMETSAKTGLNAKKLFTDIGISLYKDRIKMLQSSAITEEKEKKMSERIRKNFELNEFDTDYDNENMSGCC